MNNQKRLRNIWNGMKRRCLHPSPSDYLNGIAAYYHEKGIRIYAPWVEDFNNFYDWAIKNGYSDSLTIDRIDPDGDYSPENCRWIPLEENLGRVRRNTTDSSSSKRRGIYFTAVHLCGTSFARINHVHLCYSDARLIQKETKLPFGSVLIVSKHKKSTLNVKPGDIIDFPFE